MMEYLFYNEQANLSICEEIVKALSHDFMSIMKNAYHESQ